MKPQNNRKMSKMTIGIIIGMAIGALAGILIGIVS
jgi:gas vesicle protein